MHFFFRLAALRLSSTAAIATKAPQLLNQLVQDKNVRANLAERTAFEALIPIVKEEMETKKCGTKISLIYVTQRHFSNACTL